MSQKKFQTGIDLVGNKLVNLATPVAATDGATRQYVDDLARGLRRMAPVLAATTAPVAATGLGASLTVDGVVLANGDSFLRKNETNAANNGIYVFNTAGGGTISRRADADSAGELADGSTVFVQQGTANGDKQFTQTTNNDTNLPAIGAGNNVINIGTTLQVWVMTGGGGTYVAGAGITITGNTIASTGARKLAATIGNGAALNFDLTHNWNTQDVQIALREIATNQLVEADFIALDNNTARVTFLTAPAANSFRMTAFG